ncbi:glycosyltransferase family 2 protein [bacterium (Candidatus Howlettbacteria) CG_4_10_14_3_um_filter_37_10]|nr:MAG: glycosyltransferase family 2 protein [bacterium (Candidatus Howlettbacteria) CG_4_10_14_3_um_filter_37_10]
MKVSIIIPIFNNLDYTKKCLNALKSNTRENYLEDIIIIDNKSSDGSEDYISRTNWVRLLSNDKNEGFAKACNRGTKNATGKIFIFLNNDTEVQRGWVEPLIDALEDEEVAISGPRLLFPNGLIQNAGVIISSDHIPRHIYVGEDSNKPYVNKKREFNAVTGACLAIKKNIFDDIGGFDEEFINGMEDIDLCLKVRKMGKKILYCPKSVVIHRESMSPGRSKFNKQNNELYLKRWSNIEPDEQTYYKEDGRNILYRLNKELNNKYLSDKYKDKVFLLQIPGYIYRLFRKIFNLMNGYFCQ